tara:strand:+ start:14044 stop:16083 length:2040 start_codon:yes stop_codon:yes gene_type:complete
MLIFGFLVACQSNDAGEKKELLAKIDLSKTKEPISKYLYGMFMENLGNDDVGNIVDDALWAELLDDRKFFYPVNMDTLNPINRKEKINRWRPIGQVIMDTLDSYVGVHSPKVITSLASENGIEQSGIAIKKGKTYNGRIILKASKRIEVTVKLETEQADEQLVLFKDLKNDYKSYYFSFISNADNPKATLKITGSGSGSFTIGTVSLMPADNIDGFRPDVLALLKGLNSGIYRWGGNFISGYDWRDGVGNPDKRAPRYEYAWECLEDNDVGTEEMIRFAELIGVELSMTVNTGFGDAFSAAQWVEYVNGSKETPMGKLREQNGHSDPYGIKLWCVGNESYGWWQLGHIPLKDHIIKHNIFSEKMLQVDPSIKLIGSGASIEEMTVTENSFRTSRKVIPEYDSETDWTGGMLKNANDISFMSEHFYCSVAERFDLEKVKYIEVDAPLEDWTQRPANRIKLKAEHYNEYHKRTPKSKNIPIYLDEWAYYTNWVHPKPTLGVTIGYARALNEMFRHTDLYKMAGFTFGTSCLSFTDTEVDYNATGLMFKLYQSQLGSIPLEVEGNQPQPKPKYQIGGDQPKENAGGNLYPLDVIATLSEDKTYMVLSIINPTLEKQAITFAFGDTTFSDKATKWTLSGTSVDGRNIVNKDPQVKVIQSEIESTNKLTIEPATINLIKYKIKI